MKTLPYKILSTVTVALLIAVSLIPQNTLDAETQSLIIKVNWRVHSNPTVGTDYTLSVCEVGDFIYVVGVQDGRYARIEMRSKSSGSLVKTWSSKDFGGLFSCVAVKQLERLYIIDWNWSILVFDLDLNLQESRQRSVKGWARSIVFYDGYLYIAGSELVGRSDYRWRVEKWRAEDLAFIKEYTSNPTTGSDEAHSINVNPVMKQLWVVGYFDGNKFRVEILDLNLSRVKVIGKTDRLWALTVTIDEDGYAYIGGRNYTAKYDRYGNEIAILKMPGEVRALLYANNYIYAGTLEELGRYERQVLYIFDRNLVQGIRTVLSWDIEANARLSYRMAFDSENLYIAGHDTIPGNWEWNIYSIRVTPAEPTTVTQTVTSTITTTETTTRTTTQTITAPTTTTATVIQPTTVTQTVTSTITTTETTTRTTTQTITAPTTEIITAVITKTIPITELRTEVQTATVTQTNWPITITFLITGLIVGIIIAWFTFKR
jgi:hypothetical protein